MMQMVARFLLSLLLMSTLLPSEWREVGPDFDWSFPRDHWAHRDFKTEWWYLTGHLRLKGRSDYRFGYQFTFFRVGMVPQTAVREGAWKEGQMIMGHAAVSDVANREHRFSEVLYRETPFLGAFSPYPDPRIAWSLGPAGTKGPWRLSWNGKAFDCSMQDSRRGFAFSLSTKPLKPRVFQGPNGYSRKSNSSDAASHYFSFTRLQTSGSVTLDNRSYEVAGVSWMDKEFSSAALSAGQVGWDWFSFQLDDGREIMLYSLRDREGAVDFASGTVVDSGGTPRYLNRDDWHAETMATWVSEQSRARYPVAWRINIPSENLRLTVRALFDEQENRSQLIEGLTYWEGAVIVLEGGRPKGRGFAELTGYAEGSRLPL